MLICFSSLSINICSSEVDRCLQADMQAVWATFPWGEEQQGAGRRGTRSREFRDRLSTAGTRIATIS